VNRRSIWSIYTRGGQTCSAEESLAENEKQRAAKSICSIKYIPLKNASFIQNDLHQQLVINLRYCYSARRATQNMSASRSLPTIDLYLNCISFTFTSRYKGYISCMIQNWQCHGDTTWRWFRRITYWCYPSLGLLHNSCAALDRKKNHTFPRYIKSACLNNVSVYVLLSCFKKLRAIAA